MIFGTWLEMEVPKPSLTKEQHLISTSNLQLFKGDEKEDEKEIKDNKEDEQDNNNEKEDEQPNNVIIQKDEQ